MNPEEKAAASSAFVMGAVHLQDLREKDEIIEAQAHEIALLEARVEELSGVLSVLSREAA